MIHALAANRPDQAVHIGILPRRLRRGKDFPNAQPSCGFVELLSIAADPIAQQITRSNVPGECFQKLPRRPFSSGVVRYGEVNWTAAVVAKNHEDKQDSKRDSWDHEEVGGDEIFHLVFQESAPGLRRWFSMSHYVFRDSRLRHLNTKFQQLPMNARGTPARIGQTHFSNEVSNLAGDCRTAFVRTTLPSPVESRTFAMPSNDGFRFDDENRR